MSGLISVGSPLYFAYILQKAITLFFMDRFEEAEILAAESLLRQRASMGFAISISSLGHLGRVDDASEVIEQYIKWWPEVSVEAVEESERAYRTSEKFLESLVAGLRLAGLD